MQPPLGGGCVYVLQMFFTQPPMRRVHICLTDVFLFFFVFFVFFLFFPSATKYETTVLGNS